MEDEAEQETAKQRRKRKRKRNSLTDHMGAEEGLQHVNTSAKSLKVFNPSDISSCFTVNDSLERYREKAWIKREGEIMDIKYLHSAALIM